MSFNKILSILVVIAIVVAGFFYFKNHKTSTPADTSNNSSDNTSATPTPAPTPTPTPTASAVATVATNLGSFQITLDATAAPLHTANFIKLAKAGYYNGLTFHRIVQDFVIQGGDPNGDGSGGPGYTIPAEIKLKHTKGAVGMASTAAKGPSSGSQFYIALQALPQLDGNYTVFGYVTSGMDVVTKISQVPTEPNPETGEQSIPLQKVTITSVTIQEK